MGVAAAAVRTAAVCIVVSGLLRDEAAAEEAQIIRTPQRVLEGIELADLRGAFEVTDERPWEFMARLVPSVFTDFPTLCNLVYIKFAIYLAPLKCLMGVDTKIVAIRHLRFLMYVEVAVFPDEPDVSASYFDDVAFLIAKNTSVLYKQTAPKIIRANITNRPRTDDTGKWITELESSPPYQLIGFVDVGLNLAKRYRLYTRLYVAENVTFSMEQCSKELAIDQPSTREPVPCVLLCQQKAECTRRFLYTLGSLLLDHSKTVIGISSWQDNTDIRYMRTSATHPPIGLAIPNKGYYKNNLNCALAIRNYHWESSEPLKYFRDYSLYGRLCKAIEKGKLKRSRAPIIV